MWSLAWGHCWGGASPGVRPASLKRPAGQMGQGGTGVRVATQLAAAPGMSQI